LGELVGWTIRAAGHAGRELDGVYLHHRRDEFRCRMVGKPIGFSPLQLLTGIARNCVVSHTTIGRLTEG
jgi:hypothetical protein